MTKAELLVAIAKAGLNEELAALGSDPKKATNKQLIDLLEAAKKEVPAVEEPVIKGEVETKDNKKVEFKGKKMTLSDVKDYLNTALPYIIVDHDNSYEIKDDDDNRVVEISWGNRVVGKTVEKVALHGLEQYVTRGGIQVMKEMSIPKVKIDEKTGNLVHGKPKKRFSITESEGFTEEQVLAIRKKQRLEFSRED